MSLRDLACRSPAKTVESGLNFISWPSTFDESCSHFAAVPQVPQPTDAHVCACPQVCQRRRDLRREVLRLAAKELKVVP